MKDYYVSFYSLTLGEVEKKTVYFSDYHKALAFAENKASHISTPVYIYDSHTNELLMEV